MKKNINILSVTDYAVIRGPLAWFNMWIMFFGSLAFFGLFAEILEYLVVVFWIIFQLIFQNLIIPQIQKVKKPQLTYNPRTKKLKYYHHPFQFKTFDKNADIVIRTGRKGRSIEIDYAYHAGRSGIHVITIKIDPRDYDVIKQIQTDWHNKEMY